MVFAAGRHQLVFDALSVLALSSRFDGRHESTTEAAG